MRSGPVWVHVMDPVPVVWINSDLAEAHADATGKCVWGVQRDGGLTHAVPACGDILEAAGERCQRHTTINLLMT